MKTLSQAAAGAAGWPTKCYYCASVMDKCGKQVFYCSDACRLKAEAIQNVKGQVSPYADDEEYEDILRRELEKLTRLAKP